MDKKEYFDMIKKDYANALIHLVCLNKKENHSYDLVFGFVEFFPYECKTIPIETEWQSFGMKKYRLFYRRKKVSVQDGIDFFLSAQGVTSFTLTWDDETNEIKTEKLYLDSNIAAPYLSDHQKLPFIADQWGVVRVQSLFPIKNDTLVKILCYQKIAEWLTDRLCFNLVKDFSELIGSMHFCLPNPIYRFCRFRLIPGNTEKPSQVQIHFTPRENYESELKNLTLCMLEKRSYGYAGDVPTQVLGEYTRVSLIGGDEKVGGIIYCPRRGLLGYTEFNNFFHTMHVDIVSPENTTQYIIENKSNNTETSIVVEKKRIVSEFTCGLDKFNNDEIHDAGKRIRKYNFNKEMQKKANELGQFVCDDPDKSKIYVTKILNEARKRVIIIDPYFEPEGLFHYIKSIELCHIVPEVIVSAEGLKQEFKRQERQDNGDIKVSVSTNADIFEKFLEDKEFKNTLTISVMLGMGKFHDRFLITDEKVWLSGNSLNSLGKRLSTIICLPDGRKILDTLEKLRESELKPFGVWLAKHRQENS